MSASDSSVNSSRQHLFEDISMPHRRQEYRTKSSRIGILDVLLYAAIVGLIIYISFATA